ncbi:MAG: hypothetical protein J2P37_19350 [Ktedonobacteraceae bacterium]|nr:hypothetical protein [Ktedonobacteraceae bacterium]
MSNIDPKNLVIGQGLQVYRDEPTFGSYLRLIQGKGEQAIDLDELAAWKLLQILLADLERLAIAVYQGEIRAAEPNFRCRAADQGCTNRVTESTGFDGFCAVHRDLAEQE